ncbi:prephenate dehydrogenase [Methanococcus voltae]|uniref:Prephenate dehydrogenase n=1 Tax=Methanococcus voltae TaxID=2188 RepID=A0A8J7RM72_METVO|nr:prephenate dehydrogenase/arogenate dehydrogenase family protein [Methanococcus voltae]MBP2200794.1 prephenate dehydrogenase [Methanococcus voltae]
MDLNASKISVSIIGGTDGLGKWFAKFLKESIKKNDNFNFEITVTGRNKEKGTAVSQELDLNYCSDNIKAVEKADIVIIAVPISHTLSVIEEVAPHIQKGSILMDMTSVKEKPSLKMMEFTKTGVSIIPTHPMFGPSVPSIAEQVVILTPVERCDNKHFEKVKEFLENAGAKVIVVTPQQHDEIISVIQGLTHFVHISLGSTLRELGVSIKDSRNFASPIYEMMINMVGRIVGQNANLYADIQMNNDRVTTVHDTFINECIKLRDTVHNKDKKAFIEDMELTSAYFGEETKKGLYYSNKAVNAIVNENMALKESIGKEITLKHIYTGKMYNGILNNIIDDKLILKDLNDKKEYELNIYEFNLL